MLGLYATSTRSTLHVWCAHGLGSKFASKIFKNCCLRKFRPLKN